MRVILSLLVTISFTVTHADNFEYISVIGRIHSLSMSAMPTKRAARAAKSQRRPEADAATSRKPASTCRQ